MPLFSRRPTGPTALPDGHDDKSSSWYVAPDLRDAYLAHEPSFDEVKSAVRDIIHQRANVAYSDAQETERAKNPESRYIIGSQTSERAKSTTLDAGEQEGDAEYAEHLCRLDYARRDKAQKAEAERREKARQEARCRMCEALDVPTAPAVVELVPASVTARSAKSSGQALKAVSRDTSKSVTLSGGPVCDECSFVAVHEYREKLATEKINGTSRRELAKRFIEDATK